MNDNDDDAAVFEAIRERDRLAMDAADVAAFRAAWPAFRRMLARLRAGAGPLDEPMAVTRLAPEGDEA